MKAYKVFNNDWSCNGFQYEIGKTYEFNGDIRLCSAGFHACKNLHDCFKYYPCVPWNKIAEVSLLGDVLGEDGDKQVTNKIKIVREIPFENIGNIIKEDLAKGVAGSDGVAWSKGVVRSTGVANSFGVSQSCGVNLGLFVVGVKHENIVFNKTVSAKRFDEIMNKLTENLNGWYPTFNNLKSLYLKSGNSWKNTPIPQAKEIQKKEAWADMPQKAIYYLKSLPEFDPVVFESVTGIVI